MGGVGEGDAAEDFVEPAFLGVKLLDRAGEARAGDEAREIAVGHAGLGQDAQEIELPSSLSVVTLRTPAICSTLWRSVPGCVLPTRSRTEPAFSLRCLSSAGVPFATIWPRSMMMAREQTASTSSRMCVEKTMAFFSPIRRMRLRISNF